MDKNEAKDELTKNYEALDSAHTRYMDELKTRKRREKPEPLTEEENRRLRELYDTRGMGYEEYMKWLKDDEERRKLLHKRAKYLETLSGACPPGTVYDPTQNKCIEI